jgi:HlyD family secretion protein
MTRSEPDNGTSTEAKGPDGAPAPEQAKPHQASHSNAGSPGDPPPPLPSKWVFFFVVVGAALLLGYGGYKHWALDADATTTQKETIDFVPTVRTITTQADTKPTKLILPGQTDAFDSATLYPRATGYVSERLVDIGSRVKKGDLLLRIAAPDTDRQLDQARAQLKQVQATMAQAQATLDQAKGAAALADLNFKRSKDLVQRGYDTVQNNDTQQTNVTTQKASVGTAEAGIKVAAANEQAQQATVDRLVTLTQFEEVRAPFEGIIVTRGVDVGDLVNADSKTGASLFTVAKDAVIRATVHIPQTNAVAIRDGLEASVAVPQIPNRVFTGKIARSSVALLNSSRTLTTEVDIQNPDGALRPGLFVNVTFEIPRLRPNIVVPSEALIFNQGGLQVAVVQDDQVHMQKITIYRDFGKTVELESGLNGGEAVIMSPPADLQDGSKVKLEPKKPEEQAQK